MAINLMMTASSALLNHTTSKDRLLDDNNADPAPRIGILQDTSSGELKQDSDETSACRGMLELNNVFKKIGDVMTSYRNGVVTPTFQQRSETN